MKYFEKRVKRLELVENEDIEIQFYFNSMLYFKPPLIQISAKDLEESRS